MLGVSDLYRARHILRQEETKENKSKLVEVLGELTNDKKK